MSGSCVQSGRTFTKTTFAPHSGQVDSLQPGPGEGWGRDEDGWQRADSDWRLGGSVTVTVTQRERRGEGGESGRTGIKTGVN